MGSSGIQKEDNEQYFQYPTLAKDNMLIGAKYKASLLELRTTYASLMMIQEGNFLEQADGYYVEMTAAQLADIIGVNGGAFYKQLKPVAEHMTNRTFGVVDEENESFDFINLIIEAKYKDGVFTVVFNKKMKEHIMNLERDFTPLPKKLMMSFNSEYSFRLYELLKKSCYYPKNFKGQKNGKFRIDMSLSELKLSIGVVNSALDAVQNELKKSPHPDFDKAVEKSPERLYDNWADFRRRCLEPPIDEINEKSDINVSYEAQRSGRGGKIYAIRFNIYVEALDETIGTSEIENDIPTSVDKEGNASINLDTNEKFEIWVKVYGIFVKEDLQFSDIVSICEEAEYDINRISKAKDLLDSNHGAIDNVVGWIISCIKNNYEVKSKEPTPKNESKKSKGKNHFFNYPQREIDFEELEKKVFKN